jgi:hypothetical protein
VYAGAVPTRPSMGRVLIFMQNGKTGAQTLRAVNLPNTHGVLLVSAPLGLRGEHHAQNAVLGFATGTGRHGRLYIATGHVSYK